MQTFSSVMKPPRSVLPYPHGFWSQMKYVFWRAVTPAFPYVRDTLVTLHIIWHAGRQHFLLGTLKSPDQVQPFLKNLEAHGFGNHFIAWRDEGEILNIRRLDGFEYQYHLRIFENGEVRGHYELTPESHPWRHFKEVGIEHRRDDFMKWIGGWVV